MRRVFVLVVAVALAALVMVPALGARPDQSNFRAHLSGANEVPSADTNATGQAIFQVSADSTSISFKLITANIDDVLQAHIHCGAAGANSAVIAFLYPDAPPAQLIPGRSDGILSEGSITGDDVIARPTGGCPEIRDGSLEDLIAQMRAGNTYTNVHTSDFPGGEIRGQNR